MTTCMKLIEEMMKVSLGMPTQKRKITQDMHSYRKHFVEYIRQYRN